MDKIDLNSYNFLLLIAIIVLIIINLAITILLAYKQKYNSIRFLIKDWLNLRIFILVKLYVKQSILMRSCSLGKEQIREMLRRRWLFKTIRWSIRGTLDQRGTHASEKCCCAAQWAQRAKSRRQRKQPTLPRSKWPRPRRRSAMGKCGMREAASRRSNSTHLMPTSRRRENSRAQPKAPPQSRPNSPMVFARVLMPLRRQPMRSRLQSPSLTPPPTTTTTNQLLFFYFFICSNTSISVIYFLFLIFEYDFNSNLYYYLILLFDFLIIDFFSSQISSLMKI